MQKTLERLAPAGIHTVVSHGAHEYKKHWATRFVPQTRLLLFNRGFRGSAAHFVRFSVVPTWHRIRGVARAWHAGCVPICSLVNSREGNRAQHQGNSARRVGLLLHALQ